MRMTLPQCRADLIFPPSRIQFRKIISSGGASNRIAYAAKVKTPAAWENMRRTAGFSNPTSIEIETSLGGIKPFSNGDEDSIGLYYSNSSVRNAIGDILTIPGFAAVQLT